MEPHNGINVSPLRLELRHAFRIAHGSSTMRTNALVRIGDESSGDAATGVGEAALPPYYPTTLEQVRQYVESIASWLEDVRVTDPMPITTLLDQLPDGPSPARAAVDMALHDLWGKRLGAPLHVLLGLDSSAMPVSSYALPIPNSLEHLDEMLSSLTDFPFLKLKIGSGDTDYDEAIVRRTREQFDGQLCVDVNANWPIHVAVDMIHRMEDTNLAFIEQPIPAREIDDWHLLRRLLGHSPTPLIADESVQGSEDVIALAGAADGINIKLAKAGGIRPAMQLISLGRSLDLSIMLGCMIESSIALTAAAHLGPLTDWLDLDGPMHLAADPYSGLTFDRGTITLSDRPGLGVVPTS